VGYHRHSWGRGSPAAVNLRLPVRPIPQNAILPTTAVSIADILILSFF